MLSKLISPRCSRSKNWQHYGGRTTVRKYISAKQQTIKLLPGVTLSKSAKLGIVDVNTESVETFDQVLMGNDVLVFGYPTSLGLQAQPQLDLHRPLLRKGIVAGQNLQKKWLFAV